jgi:predicted dehydrogenase
MSNRRTFIQQSSVLAAGTLLFPRPFVAPSDQVNIGAVGLNGMGWADLSSALKIPGVNVVALCDIDQNVLNKRMGDLAALKVDTGRIKLYTDYRKLLEQKDIDVVLIGTPDHWHALIMIAACQAGKDVYVEKPCGNSIGECRVMVAAQKKYNRIVQVGQWQRSQQHFKDAVDFVQSGQLGSIRTVKVWCYQGWMRPAPVVADSAPPSGVDYAMWLGPAPSRPFNASRFHFHFRWFWDYAGGLMTDWGVHLLDYGLLGMNAGEPKNIAALGGKFAYPTLAEETPDTLTTLYEFDGFNMVWDHAMGIDNGSYDRDHGIAYIGNNATLVLNRNGWEVLEEKNSKNKVAKPLAAVSDNGVDKHWVNFIEAVRSRNSGILHCPIDAAAHVAIVAQMGNASFRSGQRLTWDAKAGKFTDEKINQEYLMKEYHNGYGLPVI